MRDGAGGTDIATDDADVDADEEAWGGADMVGRKTWGDRSWSREVEVGRARKERCVRRDKARGWIIRRCLALMRVRFLAPDHNGDELKRTSDVDMDAQREIQRFLVTTQRRSPPVYCMSNVAAIAVPPSDRPLSCVL